MDKFSSRKANSALSFSRKASSGLVLRDSSDQKGDRNTHLCSRVGCGSRVNSSKGNQIGCSDKAKTTRHPFRLSNSGKEIVGSSSRTPLAPSAPRKPPSSEPRKKPSSHPVADMETSILSEESGASDNAQVRLNTFVHNHVSGEASSSNSTPPIRTGKKTMRNRDLGLRDMSIVSPASLAFKHGYNGASTSKYNFRNLKCNSRNDVVSSDMDKKRIDGAQQGSLFTRGKTNNGPLVDDRRSDRSHSGGISIASSRRTRNSNFTSRDNDVTSVGIRSADRNRSRQQTESSVDTNAPRRPSTNRANINNNGSIAPFDAAFDSSFLNTEEDLGNYRLDGIAEMLLALDGIEQDEEPTHEQLLGMETNIFLSGLAFHDQLRDMRLDIDNMSYEELLALEERMGTVSTALTEEALKNCLKRSIYHTEEGTVVGEGDDTKCCICQEDYEEGNEVGRVGCEHQYHVGCIQQWLRLKNWCPICKASATPFS